MAQTPSVAARHPEVATLVRAAAAGQPKPVYLLAGEPFETAAATHALLDVLVPAARRAFNLETYDGRTTPITTVLDSLRTPGFFAGTKVIWVRESTLFLSGEKRSEVTAALFAAWSDGREQEAAEKLLTLAALAGWSQEQFRETRWSALSKTRLREIFGDDVDAEQLAQLDAVQAACVARDLAVSAYRDDGGAVLEFLAGGLPPQTVLLFTAAAVDARKRLFKRLQEIGAVLSLAPARERSGALSRETVDGLVLHVTRSFGKRLAPAAQELILRRAGTDMAMLANELEKLCLYAGDRPSISEDDVRLVFHDMAESWIFDFTGALAGRQLARALPLLRGLIEQGEPPLRLLAMIAREVRMLLLARECLDDALRGKWRTDLPFNAFQSRVLPHLDAETRQAFGNVHPFVLYRRLQDAARVNAGRLRDALIRLSDLDVRLKSSRSDPALLLELFVMDWCGAKAREAQR
ncbi:MAG TPA: DNA polymerase III subunit delta [Candidatus Acidoferrales bacterium]|nr:DNA polymerase III subunit delta [Candidatus Acidoferrales bacterium]